MAPGEGVSVFEVVDSSHWIPTRRKFHIGRCFGVSDRAKIVSKSAIASLMVEN